MKMTSLLILALVSPVQMTAGAASFELAPAGGDPGGHVGQREGHTLEGGDRRAELLARRGVFDGGVERPLRQTDGAGSDAEPAGVQSVQSDPESTALLPQPA